MTGPLSTYGYEVVATAPYMNSSNQTISSQAAYVEFVASGQAGISPAGSYTAALDSSVPITIALPPTSSGSAQANVPIQLTVTGHAYFTNSSGANLGQTIDVSTNSSGLAQAWVSDATAESVTVTATINGGVGLNSNTLTTTLNFAQAGVPASIQNYANSGANQQVAAGTKVTISGTLVDATGNPVPNGQILVIGWDSDHSGDFGYVTSSGTTDFPNVGSSLAEGTVASSALGDLVTADSSGNFSFQVTDTDAYTAYFNIYAVNAGQVGALLKSDSIEFVPGTTLSAIGLGATDNQADSNTYTKLTGLSGSDGSVVYVYADPQNASGSQLPDQSLTYTVSVSSGDILYITNAAGTVLPVNGTSGLSAVTVNVTWTGSEYEITVPGQSGVLYSSSPDFGVGVTNSGVGTSTLTITSGSVSSTATIDFTSGEPTYTSSMSPVASNLAQGQNETVTITFEDADGNPVNDAQVAITSDDSTDPLWITAVNGSQLTQYEPAGSSTTASVATPIPLSSAAYSTTPSYLSNGGVNIPGVVSWNGSFSSPIYLYTNSEGQVTLTLQNGGVTYYTGGSSGESFATSTGASSGSIGFYTYSSDTAATSTDLANAGELVIGSPNSTYGATYSLGTITLGTGGSTSSTGTFSYVDSSSYNYTYSNTSDTFTVSGTQSVSGGTYAITSFTPVGGTATSTIPSGVSVNSSTGTVSVSQNAAVGTYTVSYELNGVTESTGTFKVYSDSGVTNQSTPASSYTVAFAGGATSAPNSGTLKVTVSGGSSSATVYVNVTAGESANSIAAAIYSALENANPSGYTFSVSGSTVNVTAPTGGAIAVVDATGF